MLGRVDGPYEDIHNRRYVSIVTYNEDGSVKSKLTKNYNTYIKEKTLGYHQYNNLSRAERKTRYFNKVREDYNLPLVTEDNKEQFYYPNAYEIEKLPGYFYIPFEGSIYAINKEGDVINLGVGKLLKANLDSSQYYRYGLHYLNNAHSKKRIRILQHRMLALLFISKPDRHANKKYDDLHVNHKDGVKTNNKLNNLEWVTHIENLDHAVIAGLSATAGIAKPVLAKNIITGEIKRYLSVGSCAKDFDIDNSGLSKHLNSDNYGLVSVNNYIFKLDNNRIWPNCSPIVKNNRGYFKTKSNIVVKNVTTNESFIFKSMIDAITQLKLNDSLIYKHFKKYGKDVPYKDYLFFNLNDFKTKIKQ